MLRGSARRQAALAAKRLGDVLLALVGLFVLSPLIFVAAVAITLDSRGPIIFRQQRVGFRGRPFWMYKFRSMTIDAGRNGPVSTLRSTHVTRVGRLLRLSSFDELPQLVNVLKGDMGLVGPRPLLPGTIRASEARRHEMRPGCTGIPVVSGRQAIDWDERIRLDLWYVDHWSLWLDVAIMLKTVPVLLSRRNVYNAKGETPLRPAQ
jgi:lipopolysaccharide/colanic/teichoic acid biosynthesis glycosyltransferase